MGRAPRCASRSLPAQQPQYVNYIAWRAMLDEANVPTDLRATLIEDFLFCLPDGGDVPRLSGTGRNDETAVGRRAYNMAWYRPTDPDVALPDLCTDPSGRRHVAIPR